MINNPYNTKGLWLKGNLHTHTENSPCGHYSLNKVIDMYTSYNMNYDFLAITDHYHLTELNDFIGNDKIILFSGVEYKYGNYQTLGINVNEYCDDEHDLTNHQQIFNVVQNQGGINIICHPHAFKDDYWPSEKLLELNNYTGIEIYNNNIKFDNKGRAVATDLWDELLSKGKKVFAFSNDDMHIFQRCGGAFNMVLASERTADSILDAIKMGSFYASTGIFLESIEVENSTIKIELKHTNIPAKFTFIGHGGKILQQVIGTSGKYTITGNENYVRAFISREDGAMAWTQPFWL